MVDVAQDDWCCLHNRDPEPIAVLVGGVTARYPHPQTDHRRGATPVLVGDHGLHVGGRVHRRRREPERRHDPVTKGLDHLAVVTHHDGAQPLQMTTPQHVPRVAAQRPDQLGRTNHVGEHHRHSAGTTHERRLPRTPR
jgi:hypothetical protein